jgi:hypothetical protein
MRSIVVSARTSEAFLVGLASVRGKKFITLPIINTLNVDYMPAHLVTSADHDYFSHDIYNLLLIVNMLVKWHVLSKSDNV